MKSRSACAAFGLTLLCACTPPPTSHSPPVSSSSAPPKTSASLVQVPVLPAAVPTEETPPSKWIACEKAPRDMGCVSGGEVLIGDNASAETAPQHTAEIQTFYLDKQPVSNSRYDACEKANQCPARSPAEKTQAAPNEPASALSWSMAHAYCNWAGKRLPTEAEWEKAFRSSSNNPPNFAADTGLEWTQDLWSDCYEGCSSPCKDACLGLDPPGICSGAPQCGSVSKRVLKGPIEGVAHHAARRRGELPKNTTLAARVRCASTSPWLSGLPPLAISDPPTKPPPPTPPTEKALSTFLNVKEDTDVFKIPLCKKTGEASQKCRDPWSYVTSNEPEQALFLPYIKHVGGGYVGLASDQNYTFIAHAKSEWAWLFDYDPTVVRLHYILRAVIIASASRREFVERFDESKSRETTALVKASFSDKAFVGQLALTAEEAELTLMTFHTVRGQLSDAYTRFLKLAHADHWLKSDEAYSHVRLLYQQGRIVALKGNLLTTVAIPSIGAASRAMSTPINVYYTSNADDQWPLNDAYRQGIMSLPFGPRGVMLHTTLPNGRGKVTHDWDYVVHSGMDIQRYMRRPGWDHIAWLSTEGRRVGPKLITIALPSQTEREP
ncbi:MAG: formylglycine-generating enzyme family protein [Polyangiaceae bacterium]|nr:formylglycine-generating enzyme family protein [Polyangiaceae bacterium]